MNDFVESRKENICVEIFSKKADRFSHILEDYGISYEVSNEYLDDGIRYSLIELQTALVSENRLLIEGLLEAFLETADGKPHFVKKD